MLLLCGNRLSGLRSSSAARIGAGTSYASTGGIRSGSTTGLRLITESPPNQRRAVVSVIGPNSSSRATSSEPAADAA